MIDEKKREEAASKYASSSWIDDEMIGSKRIKLSEGTTIHIQNELVLALKELEDE